MTALMHLLSKNQKNGNASILKYIANKFSQFSEGFWFLTSFLLFLALGPFSIIAVIIAMGTMVTKGQRAIMKEPASN